jgi:CheY-specific phosphatase CheX
MEPDEEIDQDDMFDSIGEVANIIAGSVKTSLAGENISAQLGLPLAVEGRVHTTENAPRASIITLIDGHQVWLNVSGTVRK